MNGRVNLILRRRSRRLRSGMVFAYTMVIMTALMGICSLAVDLGRVQMVKNDMQSCADSTARAYMDYYNLYGQSYANTNGPAIYSGVNNPVDSNSGVSPTVSVQWGSWNTATKQFTSGVGTPVAVKVTVSRTNANGNGVSLIWGTLVGKPSCDVSITSIAALIGSQSVTATFSATANPYLAGMPAGTTTVWGDTVYNAAPYQSTITVTPGTWLTMTSVSGSTSVVPGYLPNAGPNGNTGNAVHHGENYDGNPNSPSSENGIADAVMPEDAFMGVFLGSDPPNLTAAPATIDWTAPAMQNQTQYANIQLQQPFYIGDGKTSGGTVQQFMVPQGATRLFLGIWDGICYNNNYGTMSATVNLQSSVQLVQ